MARQNTYIKDGIVQVGDKWLITDVVDGGTKNLTVEDLAQFFAETGTADPSKLGFRFDYAGTIATDASPIVTAGQYYVVSTVSNPGFANVTRILVSNTTANGKSFLPVRRIIERNDIKFTDVTGSNSDSYGYYFVESINITDYPNATMLDVVHLGGDSSIGNFGAIENATLTPIGAPSDVDRRGVHIFDGTADPVTDPSTYNNGDLYFQSVTDPDTGFVSIIFWGPYNNGWGESGTDLTGQRGERGYSITGITGDIVGQGQPTTVTVTLDDPNNPTDTFTVQSGTQGFQGTGVTAITQTNNPELGEDTDLTVSYNNPGGQPADDTFLTVKAGVQGDQGISYLALFRIVEKNSAGIAPVPSAPEGVVYNRNTGYTNLPIDQWNSNPIAHAVQSESLFEVRQDFNPATAFDADGNVTFTAASWGQAFVAGDIGPTGPQGPQGVGVVDFTGNQDGVATSATATTVTVTGTDPSDTASDPQQLGTFEVPSGVQGIQGESVAPFTGTADLTHRETDFVILGTEGTSLSTFSIPWGDNGTSIHSASGNPADTLGADGDVYINSFNGDVFTKASGTWGSPTGNITGPRGLQGTSISAGTGVPSNADGNEGDVFIDVSTGFVYNKGASVWTSVVGENLKGPQGDTGADAGVVISKAAKVGLDQTVTFTPTEDGNPVAGAVDIIVSDGNQGLYQVFVYQRADTLPTTPVGGVWNATNLSFDTLPTGWFADPSGDSTGLHVYESYALFNPADPTATLQWATPFVAGAQGATGASGANATLVGDGVAGVTTVPNKGDGTVGDATVTQSGDAQNIDFTFGIPQGIKGEPGTAATVDVGNTVTLSSGSTASVTNTGNTTNAVFNFGIPIGLPGAAAGFGTISAATGPVGVVETGPNTAKNLAFTIPAGERGESIEVDESATVTTATETTVTLRTTDTNTLAGTFDVQRGIQGAQGFYNAMVYTVAPNPGANVPTPDSGTGSGITTPPTHAGFTWSFTPPSTTGSEVIFISTAVFNPLTPTDALAWSQPYLASGGTGVQGPQGVQGPIGPQGPRGLRGFDGVQGVQGLYNLFIYRIAPTDSIPANIQPVLGSGIVAAPADWSFDPVSTTVPDGMSIWISSGLYNPAIPQAAIDWGLPFIASGEPGVPGPQGPAGTGIAPGGTLGYALVSDGNELGSAWAEFTTGYNASHQQIGFLSNGTTILASVDLSGFTPLTPSGGGPTTSNMYSSVGTAAPTTFDITAMTDNGAATHQKSIALPYNDQSGTVEQWALIAIPNDLIGSGSVRFSAGGAFDIPPDGTLTNGTSGFTGYYFQFFEAFTVIIYVD